MIYVAFIALAALVVFLSIKLSDYVDLLDKTTNISGAFIGSILLAAVTSLPELFTSFSSVVLLRENELVIGNILGSNVFNFAALGITTAFCFRGFGKAKLNKSHIVTLLGTLVMYALVCIGIFVKDVPMLGFVNIVSPFIFAVYVFIVIFTPRTEEPTEKIEAKLTKKQIILRFALAAVLLVGASVAITYVSDIVADKMNLGKTFAGALLLGLVTSLPELVSTITLCRRGNFNAAMGNISGSCTFNFLILFIADLLSFKSGSTVIFPYFTSGTEGFQSMLLAVLGIASTAFVIIMTLTKIYGKRKIFGHVVTISASTLSVSAYILFLILSTVMA